MTAASMPDGLPSIPPPTDFTAIAAMISDGLTLLTETIGGYRKSLIEAGMSETMADNLAADMALKLHEQMFTPSAPDPGPPPVGRRSRR